MVPAKNTCPTGWTTEYYGYLMSAASENVFHRTQFTCVDTTFKGVPGTSANLDGLLFHFVEGRCGSLPCPSYDILESYHEQSVLNDICMHISGERKQ